MKRPLLPRNFQEVEPFLKEELSENKTFVFDSGLIIRCTPKGENLEQLLKDEMGFAVSRGVGGLLIVHSKETTQSELDREIWFLLGFTIAVACTLWVTACYL